jgi:hypothetical protein
LAQRIQPIVPEQSRLSPNLGPGWEVGHAGLYGPGTESSFCFPDLGTGLRDLADIFYISTASAFGAASASRASGKPPDSETTSLVVPQLGFCHPGPTLLGVPASGRAPTQEPSTSLCSVALWGASQLLEATAVANLGAEVWTLHPCVGDRTPRPLSGHRLSVTGLLIKDVFPSPPSPPSCHSLCKEVAFFPGEPPPLIASQCPGKSAVSLTFILLNSAEAREFNPALILDSTIAKAMIQHFCF